MAFFQSGGTLEWRLKTLAAPERQRLRSFLGTLADMECAVQGTSETLGTSAASVWVRNPRELTERVRLFDWWRRRVCSFLGVRPGPDLQGSGSIVM